MRANVTQPWYSQDTLSGDRMLKRGRRKMPLASVTPEMSGGDA
jgi:hypothetical protein